MIVTVAGEITIICENPEKNLVIRQVKLDNRFDNPVFIEALRMKRFLDGIPRYTQSWWDVPGGICVPRGYGKRLQILNKSMNQSAKWIEQRVSCPVSFPPELKGIDMRTYQKRAIGGALGVTQGVIVSPTGSGKTLTALSILIQRSQRAVILVHKQLLADQWVDVILERMGIRAGVIGGGVWREGREVTVAMIGTLDSRRELARIFAAKIGILILDECHHAAAISFANVIGMFPAMYRYGFTATPERGDGLGGIVNMVMGDVVATVDPDEVEAAGGIVPILVEVLETGCLYPKVLPGGDTAYNDLLDAMLADSGRNAKIALLAQLYSQTRPTLVLAARVEHVMAIGAWIYGALVIHGKIPLKERRRRMALIPTAPIVVATMGLLGEGLDVACWSCLILASPISGEGPLRQAVGRAIRPDVAHGKENGLVVDVVDAHPYTISMYKKRGTIYRRMKWKVTKVAE